MKTYIKENWKFFIFMILMCIIGGYFTTIYSINSLDQKIIDDAIKQAGSKEVVIIVSILQIALYAVILGAIGLVLSNKMGLWKKIEKNKNAIILQKRDSILHSYDSKPSFEYIIASLTYGAVFEEILLRLFFMSLLSWIISKIFYRKENKTPTKVFIIANVISALLFALLHIPATIQTFGYIDGLLLFRCLLMNGLFGLSFGWLYRKYGIGYSMLAHFGCHLISKLIWILYI